MVNRAEKQEQGLSNQARHDIIKGLLAIAGFLVLSLALLLWLNPSARWQLFSGLTAYTAEAPLALTVAHTNDTWGYTQACG